MLTYTEFDYIVLFCFVFLKTWNRLINILLYIIIYRFKFNPQILTFKKLTKK